MKLLKCREINWNYLKRIDMYYVLAYKLQVYVKVTEKEVTRSEVLEFHTSRSYNSSRANNKIY